MARSHSHSVKIGEAKKARRRKRQAPTTFSRRRLTMDVEWALAWVCNDASCTVAHGGAA